MCVDTSLPVFNLLGKRYTMFILGVIGWGAAGFAAAIKGSELTSNQMKIALIIPEMAIPIITYIALPEKRSSNMGKKYETIDPFKSIFAYSFPLFFASIMTTSANYLDRIVVSYFLNLSYMGIYNFA